MDGLEKLIALLISDGVKGQLWIDGSFLTEKLEPDDSDVVLRVTDAELAMQPTVQGNAMHWINNTDLKPTYMCDAYAFVEYKDPHPLKGIGEWDRAYWIRQFGFSRKDEPKGMPLIQL